MRLSRLTTNVRDTLRRVRMGIRLASWQRAIGAPAQTRLPILTLSGAEQRDQLALLWLAQKGKFARTWYKNKLTTHVFDLAAGRRLLQQAEDDLKAPSFDSSYLFPHGSLRQMEGETHRAYRRDFSAAFRAVRADSIRDEVEAICDAFVGEALSRGSMSTTELERMLRVSIRHLMIRLCLGATGDALAALVNVYGDATSANFTEAFTAASLAEVERILASAEVSENSLFGYFRRTGLVDATTLGNTALFVVRSGTDLAGLWSWSLVLLARNPGVLDWVAALHDPEAVEKSRAVVQEILRLERSEYLKRIPKADMVFEGLAIPAGSLIRIGVWEAHKDPGPFPDAFRLDPSRFVGRRPSADHYAPLGMDRHQCLGEDWGLGTTAAFVRTLARRCRVELAGDTHKADYDGVHFIPSRALEFRFQPR